MVAKRYENEQVLALLPLLGSIGNEIQERSAELSRIEEEIEALSSEPGGSRARIQNLEADAAAQKRGLRLARKELDRLGCSVVDTRPLTFRIPGRDGDANHSVVWQTGESALK